VASGTFSATLLMGGSEGRKLEGKDSDQFVEIYEEMYRDTSRTRGSTSLS
jgi:hypothetical protein